MGFFTNGLDFGAVGTAGSASFTSPTYTVAGGDARITGTADACQYVYKSISGNCTIIARVASFTNTNSNARAGVMMRQKTSNNAIEASALFSPHTSGYKVYFHYRISAGGSTTTANGTAAIAPYWVKLVRNGTTVSTFKSAGGTTWTQVGSNTTVTMTDPILIGLAVTNGLTAAASTATFDNVTITTP